MCNLCLFLFNIFLTGSVNCWIVFMKTNKRKSFPGASRNNSTFLEYFVKIWVNFPFSCLKSCFSTILLSWKMKLKGHNFMQGDKRVPKLSFYNKIIVEKQNWKRENWKKNSNFDKMIKEIAFFYFCRSSGKIPFSTRKKAFL